MKEKYKKENFEPIVKSSENFTEILKKLNITIHGNGRKTIKKYIKLYDIDISHFETKKERYYRVNGELGVFRRIPLEEILVQNSTYSRVKDRLYNEGLKERKCELCSQGEEWKGKKMSLILDHINGINDDNRIENLQIVCPNCNATLDTHCRGIKKIKTKTDKKEKNKESIITRTKKVRKVNRPKYGVLLIDIKNLGYSGTGRKYGVSDNSIRKWVKFYEKYELTHQGSNLN